VGGGRTCKSLPKGYPPVGMFSARASDQLKPKIAIYTLDRRVDQVLLAFNYHFNRFADRFQFAIHFRAAFPSQEE
jgi:hypothetical protein